MDQDGADFKAALNEILGTETTDHLTREQLESYSRDLLAAEDEEKARDHLAACRTCSGRLLEKIEGSDVPEDRPLNVTDLEAEADWRSLRARLHAPAPADAANSSLERPCASATSVSASRLRLALAASLLAALGLGMWGMKLQSELAALRAPQTHIEIVSLAPDGFTRGGVDEVTVHGAGERFVVLLNPSVPAHHEHGIEIVDATGHIVWAHQQLAPTDLGAFQLELSRGLLAPGTYRIRLLPGNQSKTEFVLYVAEP